MLIQSSLLATESLRRRALDREPERAKVTGNRFVPILNDFHLTVETCQNQSDQGQFTHSKSIKESQSFVFEANKAPINMTLDIW